MTTWKGPRTKIETWRNWRSDGQTERWAHGQERPNKRETEGQRETRCPERLGEARKRNQRINWSQHAQRETRGEGETSQEKTKISYTGGRGKQEQSGRRILKGGKPRWKEAFRLRGGVRVGTDTRCLSRNLDADTDKAVE